MQLSELKIHQISKTPHLQAKSVVSMTPKSLLRERESPSPSQRPSCLKQDQAHPQKQAGSEESISSIFQGDSIFKSEIRLETLKEAIPRSELTTSMIQQSSTSTELSMKYLEDQMVKFILVWMNLVGGIFLSAAVFNLLHFQEFNAGSQALMVIQYTFLAAILVVVAFCHKRENRDKIWVPLFLYDLLFVIFYWFQSRPPDFYLVDPASELHALVEMYQDLDALILIGFLQNTIILIYIMKTMKARKRTLIYVCFLLTGLKGSIILSTHFPATFESAVKIGFIGFVAVSTIFIDLMFALSIYFVQAIQYTLLKHELEENRKFKYMFNSIQDGVVLLEAGEPKFINSLALKLYDDIAAGSSEEAHPRVPFVDQAIFYEFQQHEEAKLDSRPRSLKALLGHNFQEVGNSVFTTSKEISQCTRMDQVQKIVENAQASETPKFFAIRIIPILKAHHASTEHMIQITDISIRIYNQFARVERQYLALMNSTVSHEMRNPLNSMVAQIERLRGELTSLKKLASSLPSNINFKQDMLDRIEGSDQILGIAKSSTKLIQFNVEDILALPQLKQGKFTKNIAPTELPNCVEEVIRIMQFQASEKHIRVASEFTGFEELPSVLLDERRFQQVLLNYLTNGLKFTEQGGRVKIELIYVPAAPEESHSKDYEKWSTEVETFWRESKHCLYEDADFASEQLSESSIDLENAGDLVAFEEKQTSALKRIFEKTATPKLVLSVVDTGVGISLKEQTRLFKLFGTIKRTRAVNTRGVGLGLSISKMICEEFGGQVGLKSRLGDGSAFVASFELPTQMDKDLEGSQFPNRIETANIKLRHAASRTIELINSSRGQLEEGSRILVVDDEAYNCEVLRAMILSLTPPSCESKLFTCLSASLALKQIKESFNECDPFKVVFTDLSMPIMDGYQLIARIRRTFKEQNATQPVIVAVTGHTEEEFISKAFDKGADQVFSKPISQEQVKHVLLSAGLKEVQI